MAINRSKITDLILEHAASQRCDSKAYVTSLDSMNIDQLKTELARLEDIAAAERRRSLRRPLLPVLKKRKTS